MKKQAYSQKNHIILSKIYCLRTLSYYQIYEFIFEPDNLSARYCEETVKKMVSQGLIEKVGYYKDDSHYFITKKGIFYLKEYGVIKIGRTTPEFLYEYKGPTKLKIEEVYTKHQLALNQFVLEFERDCVKEFDYYDEVHSSTLFSSIRPDGIIKIENDYYFIETDMNTERKIRLNKKWDNYRRFIISKDYSDIQGKITVLFVLEGVTDNSKRISNLRDYIYASLFDVLCSKFDIVINTRNHILQYIYEKYLHPDYYKRILLDNGYLITENTFSDKSLLEHEFMNYIYKPTKNGGIAVEDGVHLEFLFDDYTNNSSYVMKKVKLYPTYTSIFKSNHNRTIKYIIVIPSEEHSYIISRQFGFIDGIYYTTRERMRYGEDIYKALFKVTQSGKIYHFSKNNFNVIEEEYTLNHKFMK